MHMTGTSLVAFSVRIRTCLPEKRGEIENGFGALHVLHFSPGYLPRSHTPMVIRGSNCTLQAQVCWARKA